MKFAAHAILKMTTPGIEPVLSGNCAKFDGDFSHYHSLGRVEFASHAILKMVAQGIDPVLFGIPSTEFRTKLTLPKHLTRFNFVAKCGMLLGHVHALHTCNPKIDRTRD